MVPEPTKQIICGLASVGYLQPKSAHAACSSLRRKNYMSLPAPPEFKFPFLGKVPFKAPNLNDQPLPLGNPQGMPLGFDLGSLGVGL